MRPVLRGVLPYTALLDGSVDLGDIEIINRALDVSDENEYRLTEYHNGRR